MKAGVSGVGRRASIVAAPLLATAVVFTGLGLSSGVLLAQKSKDPEKKIEDFDRNNFDPDRSINIDNKWLPLEAGDAVRLQGVHPGGQEAGPSSLGDDRHRPH
jgi:hypothetical protein